MPKGRGLGLGSEVKQGGRHARAKRWRKIHSLYVEFDWPHLKPWMMQRCWKRHRKTQHKAVDVE